MQMAAKELKKAQINYASGKRRRITDTDLANLKRKLEFKKYVLELIQSTED